MTRHEMDKWRDFQMEKILYPFQKHKKGVAGQTFFVQMEDVETWKTLVGFIETNKVRDDIGGWNCFQDCECWRVVIEEKKLYNICKGLKVIKLKQLVY